jgi:hypothetical protein
MPHLAGSFVARPSTNPGFFTSREVALGVELTPREFSLLLARGIAPEPVTYVPGKGGHRLFCGHGLTHAAVIGAIRHAGIELLVAAKLAGRLMRHYESVSGGDLANFPEIGQASSLYEVHGRLLASEGLYQPRRSRAGDAMVEIKNGSVITTGWLDFEQQGFFIRGEMLSPDEDQPDGAENADPISLIFFNLSLAVRNAFDRVSA